MYYRYIEENNRIMEERNEALKESGDQIRKRLRDLIEEKAKLEHEYNEASFQLGESYKKHVNLEREYNNLRTELDSLKANIIQNFQMFKVHVGRKSAIDFEDGNDQSRISGKGEQVESSHFQIGRRQGYLHLRLQD